MSEPLRVKAVYFDLDDTLCGYWDAAKAGLRASFEENPIEDYTPEEVYLAWVLAFRDFCPNLRNLDWYERYLEDGHSCRTELMRRTLKNLEIQSEEMAEALSESYFQHRQKNLHLFHDSLKTLEELQHHYHLGIITNGPRDIQNLQLDKLGIRKYFKNIYIEGEMGFGKPDVRVLELAEKSASSMPSETLFVGNSYRHDILPAIERGWKTTWIRKSSDVPPSAGESQTPEVQPTGKPRPDYEITEISQILQLLKKIVD